MTSGCTDISMVPCTPTHVLYFLPTIPPPVLNGDAGFPSIGEVLAWSQQDEKSKKASLSWPVLVEPRVAFRCLVVDSNNTPCKLVSAPAVEGLLCFFLRSWRAR